MQQHCIGINGSFFNTHRMPGEYFTGGTEEQAVPELGHQMSAVAERADRQELDARDARSEPEDTAHDEEPVAVKAR
jgi:hypothetical protein